MRKTLLFVLALVLFGCKKENLPPSSNSLTGSWKLFMNYNITIIGLQKTPADAATPVILNFTANNQFTETDGNTLTTSGAYNLVNNYSAAYYSGNAIFVGQQIIGTYSIQQGNPDTLIINGPTFGIDAASAKGYLRIK